MGEYYNVVDILFSVQYMFFLDNFLTNGWNLKQINFLRPRAEIAKRSLGLCGWSLTPWIQQSILIQVFFFLNYLPSCWSISLLFLQQYFAALVLGCYFFPSPVIWLDMLAAGWQYELCLLNHGRQFCELNAQIEVELLLIQLSERLCLAL